MKKLMIFILIIIIILSVAACAKNVEKSSETNLSTEALVFITPVENETECILS